MTDFDYINTLPIVQHDYETRSGYDLSEVGRVKYVKHPDAAIICMSYKVDTDKTRFWIPGQPVPEPFLYPYKYRFAAFNIQFDAYITKTLGRKHGFSEIPLANQIDVMAVAARFGLPQKLDKLGPALNVRLPKFKEGNTLKKLFCSPPYRNPKKDDAWHREQLKKFYLYCIRDVDSMDEIMSKMPMNHLPPSEQEIWIQNCLMNLRGVPVDHAAVVRINQVCDYYRNKEAKRVPEITKGAVKTIGQIKKIVEWCDSMGVELENLQEQTVTNAINDLDELIYEAEPVQAVKYEAVQKLLKLRQDIGGAAVKKFKRLEAMTVDGRIHDNSRYHGAGTGRTTGGGFQYLNLPRATLPKQKGKSYDEVVEETLKKFYDTTILVEDNPLEVGKALVRPMIKTPDGKVLLVADWSSIEYILLMWYAGEWDKVAAFKDGADPYKLFATKLFNVPYEDVDGDQRQRSKPPVLGSGYMLGWRGLIEYAEGYGVEMSEDEAQFATNTYRNEHPLVVDTWYKLKRCAHDAVAHKGMTFATNNTRFKVVNGGAYRYLIMTLPSGRSLFYCDPKLADGKYGPVIKHRGVHSTTKQWTWVYLKPQRIIENVIQGLGRDILTNGYAKAVEHGYKPIMTIYDEIVCEADEKGADDRLNQMTDLMCQAPAWAGGTLPLKAEGYVAKRFKKG